MHQVLPIALQRNTLEQLPHPPSPVGVQVEVADEPPHVLRLVPGLAAVPHPRNKHEQLGETLRLLPLQVEPMLLVHHVGPFLQRDRSACSRGVVWCGVAKEV